MLVFILKKVYNNNMSNPKELRMARIRRRLLFIDILGGCCVGCMSTDNLEFDHVFREDMSFRIGTALLMKLEHVLLELQKCQLLCHDCHVKKTNTEYNRSSGQVHGTASSYTNYKCRCIECKQGWASYRRIKNRKKLVS